MTGVLHNLHLVFETGNLLTSNVHGVSIAALQTLAQDTWEKGLAVAPGRSSSIQTYMDARDGLY